jgi:hypothetical protein
MGNGLYMIVATEAWYWAVPGVSHTGPLNGHFARDNGMTFVLCGGLTLGALFAPRRAILLLTVVLLWLFGHAGIHLLDIAAGDLPLHHLTLDFPGVALPVMVFGGLCFYYSRPYRKTGQLPVLTTRNNGLPWIEGHMLGRAEKFAKEKLGYEDMDYMRDLLRQSRAGFWKFVLVTPLVNHRKAAPIDLWHLARIGAAQHEDCGPCLQLCINAAKLQGVSPDVLERALEGGAELEEVPLLAYQFGGAVAANTAELEDLRVRLEERIGREALVDLALGAAMVRIYPAFKRGLGYARSCRLVRVTAYETAA